MRLASDARAIFAAGVAAVEPGRAVGRQLRADDEVVRVAHRRFAPNLPRSIHLVALGKAAAAMADAAARSLRQSLAGGVVIQRREDPPPQHGFVLRYATHPLPSDASRRAAEYAVRYARDLPPSAPLLVLISGGGSAMFESPAEGLAVDDLRATYAALLASGAPIQAMNTVRRHLSAVKGGWLAVRTAPRPIAALAISDVVGDRPCDIASGPTVADPTSFRAARALVERWRLATKLPRSVMSYLQAGVRGEKPETPKPGDARLRTASFHLVATNRIALAGAARASRERGYVTRILSSSLTGDTQEVARRTTRRFGRAVARRSIRKRAMAWLAGGETTVRLGPHPGRGGRNQEFALIGARECAGWPEVAILSAGTDGIDGPTDAAGGLVSGETARQAGPAGLDLAERLRRHDAYPALQQLGALVRTGPTGTNVMDLHVFLAGARSPGKRDRTKSLRPA